MKLLHFSLVANWLSSVPCRSSSCNPARTNGIGMVSEIGISQSRRTCHPTASSNHRLIFCLMGSNRRVAQFVLFHSGQQTRSQNSKNLFWHLEAFHQETQTLKLYLEPANSITLNSLAAFASLKKFGWFARMNRVLHQQEIVFHVT